MAKQIQKFALTILALGGFYFYGAPNASSCIILGPFIIGDMDAAAVVFRGRIEGYEKLSKDSNTVRLRFVVIQTYKGPPEPVSRDAIWQNSTYGVPDDLYEFTESFGHEFIVGLGPRYSNSKDDQEVPDQRWVLQKPCRPPFLFGVKEGHVTMILASDAQDQDRVEQALRKRGMIK